MAKADKNSDKLVLASGIVGIILLLFAFALAIIAGIAMFVNYFHVYGAGLLTIIAGVVLFAALILAIITTCARSAKTALATAILSIISSTTIACCLGVPFGYKRIYIMPVIAVVLSFAAFLLFTYFYVKTPLLKQFIKSKQFKYEYSELQNTIQNSLKDLRPMLAAGIITEEEYDEKEKALLSRADSYVQKSLQVAESVTASPKQTRLAFMMPVAIMCLLYIVLIPSVHFGVCKYAYEGLLIQMSDMDGWYCGCGTNFNTYDSLLPDNYKDVAVIRRELEEYEVLACIDALGGYSPFDETEQERSARARVAYKRLVELMEMDPRWGFDTVSNSKALCSNASWRGDGVYFDFAYGNSDYERGLVTNLPSTVPEGQEDEYKYMDLCYRDGVLKIRFMKTKGWLDLSKRVAYEISGFGYDAEKNEFSIQVYCLETDKTYTLTCVDEHIWSDFKW